MMHDIYNILLPQISLIFFIFVEFFLAIFLNKEKYFLARPVSLVGIFLTIITLSTVQTEPQYFGLSNSIMSDNYTLLFHFIILLSGFLVVLLTKNLINSNKNNAFSIQALLLTTILGAMNIVSANDFITLFISLELLSFPTYFLISSVNSYHSKEASFKYLITNAISSGVFLFGASYLYGLTSSLNFTEIYEIITSQESSIIYVFSIIMIVLGLISKLAIFPFANWIIDVYKGCESSILAFLSTVPKLALFGILCRLVVFPLGGSFELTFIIAFLSIITALWANTYALQEKNVKAILACSSSANASYVMLTVGLVSVYNLSTVIFYLISYAIINIAVFSYLNIIESNSFGFEISDFKGLLKTNYISSIAYIISIFALAGFPITSGFIAKIYLFSAIAHSGLIFIPFLIIVLVLTVVALYYYLKLIIPLFESSRKTFILKTSQSQIFVLLTTVFITILIGFYPEKLIELCKFIAYNI